ncbi:hypothetical protein AMECASPLE_034297 [Ameca splendens]|uniref:Uncharacterized protein n=1 Tax=Ameca splendens TaxID=208324 RepID=A0ABV0ZHQ0_9TELE
MAEFQGNHSAATVQKPQEAAATSPQASQAAFYARADPAMDPETRDPGTHHSQTEAQQSPGAQALASSTVRELAHTKAPSPGYREPQVYQQGETPATSSSKTCIVYLR